MSTPRPTTAKTLAEKVWDAHLVTKGENGEPDLIYIDLHLIHEVTSPQAFDGLRLAGRPVRRPDLTIATEDHNTPTLAIDKPIADLTSRTQIETLRKNCAEFGIRLHPLGDVEQGIVHVVGPQLGLTQPGITVVCGDSHTSTHGAFGAMAFGIGTSEVEHVMATQTLPLTPFKTMAITVEGELRPGVTAKDIILAVIAKIGTGGGQGYVLEYRGSAIRALSHGGAHDDLQHVDRGGCARRHGRARPDHLRLPEGSPARPEGRRLGCGGRLLGDARDRRRRGLRRRGLPRRERAGAVRHLGHQPRPGRLAQRERSRPGRLRRPQRSRRRRAGARVHGPRRRHPDEGHPGRRRLHGLVHQQPHRGPARLRVRHQGPEEGGSRARHGRAGLGTGAHRGRGRGHRQDRGGVRRRVAVRRLLHVPRDEPRPARARRALRVHEQPQLRGPPGQGRAHPPGVAAGRRGHRHPGHAVEPVGPGLDSRPPRG